MALPPGFLDELRGRLSLSQVVGRKVVWDARKSNQAKGDWWAPCPFHQEKTASFHVDDRKGFYYCFGCHAKGDIVSFVRETENTGFVEAVEILAREAGMTMPARDPQAAERSDRRSELAATMEEAVRFYRMQLRTAAAGPARDYLARRGLGEAALERFEIGFAPDQRALLAAALAARGVAPDLAVAAGLVARPEGGGAAYDRFRGRIIFPIRDARGRCIGLGGRAMDPGARAKYLNSPETELFDKGRSLYNHGPAREAAGKGARLVVAEGYMDVIALVEAGFPAAVAPLGTAVTEDQLRMIWRIHPEPVIALDGDAAGFRAALRVIDLALPQVEAGQGLRFAVLPQGMDPDDLIRAEGAAGFRRVLEAAQPMAALLWRRETEGQVFDSPERRAALDKRLAAALAAIRDPGLRDHYRVEFDRLKRHLFAAAGDRPVRPVQGRRGDTGARAWPFDPRALAPATAATRASALAADGRAAERLREAAVVAALMHHPALLPEVEAELSRVDWTVPAHAELCRAILAGADAAQLAAGHAGALAVLLAQPLLAVTVGARPGDDADQARRCLRLALDLHLAPRRLSAEIADAEREITGFADEGLTWRVARAAEAVSNAPRLAPEDAAEAVVAPNGVAMDADERRRLDSLTQSIDFTRGGRSRRAED